MQERPQGRPVFEADNIRDWRDHAVVDQAGERIGELESIYVDTSTDLPAFASVQVGHFGRRRLTFVPLEGATVSPDHLRVAFAKKLVKDAPSIEPDGELLAEQEPQVFEHYGIPYDAGADARRLARR